MPSFLQAIGRVFAIRIRKKRRGSTSYPSPPATGSLGSRLLSETSDVIQLVSPMVQAVAGTIPVAGTALKAAVDGLLYVIKTIDVGHLFCISPFLLIASQTSKRNKAALNSLASRLLRLLQFLQYQHEPRDGAEAGRRTALAQCVFILKPFSMSNDIARTEVSKTSGANGLRCKNVAVVESHTIL